ncbi:MAG: GSCFA domain-containing protein [Ginsengibacter sp.]
MQFLLPFQIPPCPFNITYHDKILLIGSCFSEEIGNEMKELKLDVLQNPNGILYDPISIAESLISYVENKPFSVENIFEMNGLWHSWKHHSAFSGISKEEVSKKINKSQSYAHAFLKKAHFLIITPGTAFSYQLKDNHEKVANCHKAPSGYFVKTLLTAEEIQSGLLSAISNIELMNPELKIIFTISPVRHVRDGVVENNRSKARLIEAVHSVCAQKQNTFYFPSYELVTDVLRDYRFYKNDLVHPNSTAVSFVFEKFIECFLDLPSKEILAEMRKLTSSVKHKPFFEKSLSHQKFVLAQREYISGLEKKYPFIDLSVEKEYF